MLKSDFIRAKLKLGTMGVQDYIRQLEIREEMIKRNQEKLKLAIGGLEFYELLKEFDQGAKAKEVLAQIFEEEKETIIT